MDTTTGSERHRRKTAAGPKAASRSARRDGRVVVDTEQTRRGAVDGAADMVAGLRWSQDGCLGLRRLGHHRPGRKPRFRYVDDRGRPIDDQATLERIRQLVIPPAWTEVWICADPRGHLQATGRDARGRKQYRYHQAFRAVREEQKFGSLLAFAQVLPRLRARVAEDLGKPHHRALPKEKVLAAIVRLLDETHVRIGNEAYARENRSFGLTTLRRRHLDLDGPAIRLHFRGKAGKRFDVRLTDRQVAKVLRGCTELPGRELFHCGDEQSSHAVCSHDVNAYLHEIGSEQVTAKTFRTWWGTVLAMQHLRARPPALTLTARKRQVCEVVVSVSKALGNTPAVCRRSYIHPGLLELHLEGKVHRLRPPKSCVPELSADERLVVAFLERKGHVASPAMNRAA